MSSTPTAQTSAKTTKSDTSSIPLFVAMGTFLFGIFVFNCALVLGQLSTNDTFEPTIWTYVILLVWFGIFAGSCACYAVAAKQLLLHIDHRFAELMVQK